MLALPLWVLFYRRRRQDLKKKKYIRKPHRKWSSTTMTHTCCLIFKPGFAHFGKTTSRLSRRFRWRDKIHQGKSRRRFLGCWCTQCWGHKCPVARSTRQYLWEKNPQEDMVFFWVGQMPRSNQVMHVHVRQRGLAPVQGLEALAITSELSSRYPLMQSQK